jgi:hypothetical protein
MEKTICKDPFSILIERRAMKLFNAKLAADAYERQMITYLNGLKHRKTIDNFAIIYGMNDDGTQKFRGITASKDGKAVTITVSL